MQLWTASGMVRVKPYQGAVGGVRGVRPCQGGTGRVKGRQVRVKRAPGTVSREAPGRVKRTPVRVRFAPGSVREALGHVREHRSRIVSGIRSRSCQGSGPGRVRGQVQVVSGLQAPRRVGYHRAGSRHYLRAGVTSRMLGVLQSSACHLVCLLGLRVLTPGDKPAQWPGTDACRPGRSKYNTGVQADNDQRRANVSGAAQTTNGELLKQLL